MVNPFDVSHSYYVSSKNNWLIKWCLKDCSTDWALHSYNIVHKSCPGDSGVLMLVAINVDIFKLEVFSPTDADSSESLEDIYHTSDSSLWRQ